MPGAVAALLLLSMWETVRRPAVAVGLVAGLLVVFHGFYWGATLRLKSRGRRQGGEVVLTIGPWRRAVFLGQLGLMLAPMVREALVSDESVRWAGFAAPASVLVLWCVFLGLRIRLEEDGLLVEYPPLPPRATRWQDITRARIRLGGANLWDVRGRRFWAPAILIDGYPELAERLLAQLPASVLDAQPDARATLEYQAAPLRASGARPGGGQAL